MPNFGYHFGRLKGNLVRRLYRKFLPAIVDRSIRTSNSIALDVFSYSGEAALPEQIASIRSFLRNVGRPKSFTVVSDGSYSVPSATLLEKVDPSVKVQLSIDPPAADLPEKFRQYLMTHPTGKQLAVIMSLPAEKPALYVDSDVLFFPGAVDLTQRASDQNLSAYYLADCQFSGDERLLVDVTEKKNPVNTGVLLLFRKLDWWLAVDRFLGLDSPPSFFTNQTLAHLVMHASGARPFDSEKYKFSNWTTNSFIRIVTQALRWRFGIMLIRFVTNFGRASDAQYR